LQTIKSIDTVLLML